MANILMINVPYAGHTNPTLPLAAELVKRGHSVVYINTPSFRNKIEATGAEFVPYSDFPEELTEQQIKTRCFRAAFDTALQLTRKFDLLIYEMFSIPVMFLRRDWAFRACGSFHSQHGTLKRCGTQRQPLNFSAS